MAEPDIAATLRLASAALGRTLTDPVPLGGSTRSLVLRARTTEGTSVVIKHFEPDGGGASGEDGDGAYRREAAGLVHLEHTPDLLAADPAARLLVMTDAGSAPTLADLLRGTDPDVARAAAARWARALGDLCGGSTSAVGTIADALGTPPDHGVADRIRTGVDRIAQVSGAVVPDGMAAEIATVLDLVDDRSVLVASPGDTCPDNALLEPDGRVVFLDLEGTDVHHPALDAAYTLLPFATCWCVYDPPPGFVEDLLENFTAGLAAHLPGVDTDPRWPVQVRTACLGWLLMMASVLLQYTDDPDRRLGPKDTPALTFREHVLVRWRWGARHLAADFPAAAGFLADAVAGVERDWGAVRPAGYPAFG
ncbi:hypothetical protein EXU48_08240 [Occultella glacieicola]|uniref:Aminoglycoside phosphotransferase domain-containing protein n=1 Tax=Occultella glacieicola TaxID=2518684 RepID=A0ABY2E913_9MICO|nr:hypothetical protein [Occultella glacieicola]TDE94777.1 hypothetical protein EXU48_08240 [Occultella glacieicola]